LLDEQISLLDAQMRTIQTLRQQLLMLKRGMESGAEPDLESWLLTLELTNMYNRWFSAEELRELPFAAMTKSAALNGRTWWRKPKR
jgi:hypothetical protein